MVIIDDEPLAIELLQGYVTSIPYLFLSGSCYNGIEALSFLSSNVVDLIFMDINMPKLTGLELATSLPDYKVIFTTAHSEFAVRSYEVNAVDYLMKPITFERFLKAAEKAISHTGSKKGNMEPRQLSDHFYIKSGKMTVRLFYKDLQYVEGLKDYVRLHTTKEKHIVYKRMKDLEEQLPLHFMRVHHSYIINSHLVSKIEDHKVCIVNDWIPVSDKYREVFYSSIHQRLL